MNSAQVDRVHVRRHAQSIARRTAASWSEVAKIDGLFWSNIFEHRGAVYMIGTHHHHGALVVYKSTDGGTSWSTPADGKIGLIREGKFHTAPVPVVIHNGRLWRAVEDGDGPAGWGQMYRPRVMSIAWMATCSTPTSGRSPIRSNGKATG